MRNFLLVATLFILLAVSVAAAVYLWVDFGDTQISTIGMIAMFGGVLVAVLLGAGLMMLVFLSSRRGWDDHHGFDPGGPGSARDTALEAADPDKRP